MEQNGNEIILKMKNPKNAIAALEALVNEGYQVEIAKYMLPWPRSISIDRYDLVIKNYEEKLTTNEDEDY